MSRYLDWQLRLQAFMRGRWHVPFAWGSNDCALFAADAVQAMTGEWLCVELRGYADARGALRRLRAAGGVRGIATHALGPEIPVAFAAVGDVVAIVDDRRREALGICNGGTALVASHDGALAVSMRRAVAAWRVG